MRFYKSWWVNPLSTYCSFSVEVEEELEEEKPNPPAFTPKEEDFSVAVVILKTLGLKE
jgi:hypothetical protein